MHTLNPASDEQASIAKTESSANLPAKLYARREPPPRLSAERRSVMASAARLLWTSRVSPPSSAVVPETHRNAGIHCHCYPRTSLPGTFSLPNRLAYLVPFRPLLLDQPNQNPTLTQSAHKLAQPVPPDQWAALHVRAHTRAHTHPHWKRDQILRCGDVHPNPGPTSLALINVTALRAHHHEVLDLQEDIVALTETRLTRGAQNAMAFMARQKGQRAFHPSGLALNPASFSVCTAAFRPIWVPLLGLVDVDMDVGVLLRLLPPSMLAFTFLAFTFLATGVRPSPFVRPSHGREHSTCHQE